MCSFLSTSCAVIGFIFQNAFSFFQSCFCCTCLLSLPEISGFYIKSGESSSGNEQLSKGAVIFNTGYRGRRMLKTNGKVFLPHSLYSIIFEAPF